MDALLSLFEKILVNLLLSLLLALASFCYFTNRFPPRREDINKAIQVGREMFTSSNEYNEKAQALNNRSPNLEQMLEIQKISLRRTEATLQLTKLMERLPKRGPSPGMAEKLKRANDSLGQLDQALNDINNDLTHFTEAK